MKKSITFKQIENTVSEKMVEDGYIKAENMTFGKRLIARIFFCWFLTSIVLVWLFFSGKSNFFRHYK